VGWNRKPKVIFYYDFGYDFGKMMQEAYIKQILEPHVLSLLRKIQNWFYLKIGILDTDPGN
jgi:hypothetical protein